MGRPDSGVTVTDAAGRHGQRPHQEIAPDATWQPTFTIRQQEPSAMQPAVDTLEEQRVLLSRYMVDGIERDDRVEGVRREFHLRRVRAAELRLRHVGSRELDLHRADIDADGPVAGSDGARVTSPGGRSPRRSGGGSWVTIRRIRHAHPPASEPTAAARVCRPGLGRPRHAQGSVSDGGLMTACTFAASTKSLRDRPPIAWVVSDRLTWFQRARQKSG